MNSRATTSSFHQGLDMFPMTEDLMSPSVEVNHSGGSSSSHSSSLLFNLSVLKDKLSQVQTLVGVILSPDQSLPESTSIAISSMNSTIQEIIVTATSMMSTCQQMMIPLGTTTTTACTTNELHHQQLPQSSFGNYNKGVLRGQSFFPSTESEALDWFGESFDNNNINSCNLKVGNDEGYNRGLDSPKNYDVIELDAEDLLAKYTHYCQVCGKGFKRDANLRMHMRAHGDEYKTNAALRNTLKNRERLLLDGEKECLMSVKPKKYSCPQQGCRWNQKHAKFQPLKSMVCVKNHYKRSHCPKMYVCKRCNQKQFSVLSDLRTHEKHCGDLRWQCSCGTTFSRKDKLMGHLALFVGHQPATSVL